MKRPYAQTGPGPCTPAAGGLDATAAAALGGLPLRRRGLLQAGLVVGAVGAVGAGAVLAGPAGLARAAGATPAGRVVVVGGGWAGLAAATTLRQAAPGLQLTLVDRAAQFRALPLSSAWLTGLAPEALPRLDLAAQAARQGWVFVRGQVQALDRAARQVLLHDGRPLPYDALLLAPGAVADPTAWVGDDTRAAAELRQRWGAAFVADELDTVHQGLQAFAERGGGELVMTIPPPPLRCPPAPYERAVLLAALIRRRGLKARLTVLDASGGMPRFNRLFQQRWAGVVDHRLHVQVQQVDPFARRITSTEGELRWDHALLLPPMHAGPLLAAAGLTQAGAPGSGASPDATARPAGRWAPVDPATLRSPLDAHIWLAGDALGTVSPLFGPYPKSAQVAAETGAAAALQIAAALQGRSAGLAALPASECHVWLNAEPAEQLQIDVSHRRRGDGEIVQTVRQTDNPQPRGEDAAWAQRLLQRWVLA